MQDARAQPLQLQRRRRRRQGQQLCQRRAAASNAIMIQVDRPRHTQISARSNRNKRHHKQSSRVLGDREQGPRRPQYYSEILTDAVFWERHGLLEPLRIKALAGAIQAQTSCLPKASHRLARAPQEPDTALQRGSNKKIARQRMRYCQHQQGYVRLSEKMF